MKFLMVEQAGQMEFKILPYHLVQEFENKAAEKHIVVGFRTPKSRYQEIEYSPNCVGHIELWVHDIERTKPVGWESSSSMRDIVLFSRDDAKKILDLVDKHKNEIELIVCQCDAGISRSSGAAAALSFILNGDDSLIMNNTRLWPNRLIYNTLLAVAGTTGGGV